MSARYCTSLRPSEVRSSTRPCAASRGPADRGLQLGDLLAGRSLASGRRYGGAAKKLMGRRPPETSEAIDIEIHFRRSIIAKYVRHRYYHWATSSKSRPQESGARVSDVRARRWSTRRSVRDANQQTGSAAGSQRTSLEAAHASESKLIAEKLKYHGADDVILMVARSALTILAGSQGFDGERVIGFFFGQSRFGYDRTHYVLSWVLDRSTGAIAAGQVRSLAKGPC